MSNSGNFDWSKALDGNEDAARRMDLKKLTVNDVPADVAERMSEGVDQDALKKLATTDAPERETGLIGRLKRLLGR